MTSDTNRPEPILPPPAPAAAKPGQADDATQPAFAPVSPAAPQPPAYPTAAQPAAQPPAWSAPAAPGQPASAWSAPAAPGQPASAWVAPEPGPAVPPSTPQWGAASPQPAAWAAGQAARPAQPARSRRGVTPVALAVAIVATAVLTAGTTYVAVEATHPTASSPANELAANLPSTGAGGATGNAPAPTLAPGATSNGPAPTLAPANPVPANGQASIPDIVKAVSPAVVTITAEGVTSTDPTTGQTGTGTAVGSGVIFDANGLVLTNHHVVAGNPSKITVTLKDGRTLNASIYGIDTLTDLAIVKIDGASNLPTATIGSSGSIQVGQQAIAIGSPLGDLTGSVTSGIISAVGRQIDAEGESLDNLIQTDTPINPGNSGGPLLDAGGNVIGINTAVSSTAQNIGFAIPIDIAKPLLAEASAGQPLARAWLGVRFQTIDPTLQQEASLPVANGAWIPSAAALQQLQNQSGTGNGTNPFGNGTDPFGNGTNPFGNGTNPFGQGGGSGQGSAGSGSADTGAAVVAGSPAQQAGLAAGDIITAVDGTKLDTTNTLDLLLGQRRPGQQVTLTVLRNGQTSTVTVTLGTRPQSA